MMALQFTDPVLKVALCRDHPAHPDESAGNEDSHLYCSLALQDGGKHDHAVRGENAGLIATAAALCV